MPHDRAPEGGSLSHALRGRHVAMIAIGGTIGSGLFVGASSALALAGPGALIDYAVGGLIVLFICRMLAEMAMASPGTGSFVAHIRRGLGDGAGFVAGWLYWIMWVCVVSVEALACANLIGPSLPIPYLALEILVMGFVTGINLFSVRGYGEFEYWLSLLKVGTIVAFIGACIAGLLGLTPYGVAVSHVMDVNLHPVPRGAMAIVAAVPLVLFAIGGTEASTIAAVESDDPAGNVLRATRSVALRIAAFYVISVGLILAIVPWTDVHPGVSPFLTALNRLGIPGAEVLMGGVILIGCFSALNSGLYITSRMMFELAEMRGAPRFFVRLSANGTPRHAIVTATALAFVVALGGILSPAAAFNFLLGSTGTFVLFDYVLIVLAHMRLRFQAQRRGERLAAPMWCFPLLSVVTLFFLGLVFVVMLGDPETRTQMIAGTVTMLMVVLVERLTRRRRALAT